MLQTALTHSSADKVRGAFFFPFAAAQSKHARLASLGRETGIQSRAILSF